MGNYQVDRAKWQKQNIFEQMGNIGSEVGRSFNYLKKNDKNTARAAMTRAIDLFDATSEGLSKTKSPRAKEVLRAKEEYLRTFFEGGDSRGIENYFMQFAVGSRVNS